MEAAQYLSRYPSLLRWATVGVLAYSTWSLANLLIAPFVPFFLLWEFAAKRLVAGKNRSSFSLGQKFMVASLRFLLFRLFVWTGLYRFEELPDLKAVAQMGSVVLVANHRSWFDAMFLFCLFPGAHVPVKTSYLRIPVVGALARLIGVIPLDSTSMESAHACAIEAGHVLAEGGSLVLCPEGTRTQIGPMRPFSNIFFRVALDAKTPIVPVVIHSDIPCMGPGADGKTRKIPFRRAVWRLRVLETIVPKERDRAADLSRAAQKRVAKVLKELDEDTARILD